MTAYFAFWFVLVNELTWLFVHYGVVTFCLLFTILMCFVVLLMWRDVEQERKRERRRDGRRYASRPLP